jgi:hypothetical protein
VLRCAVLCCGMLPGCIVTCCAVPFCMNARCSCCSGSCGACRNLCHVFCVSKQRYPCLACWLQVEVCCFDKTGTLTTDHLLLEGLAGLPGRSAVGCITRTPLASCAVLAWCQAAATQKRHV